MRIIIFFLILVGSTGISTSAFAEPKVSIIMEKTTYTYCERLVYSIEVSEITGEPAIIHIRDGAGGYRFCITDIRCMPTETLL